MRKMSVQRDVVKCLAVVVNVENSLASELPFSLQLFPSLRQNRMCVLKKYFLKRQEN